ncbi:MAG: gamma-glutamyl-gamma-aminobutyrate hydrolase family protein [Actinomycetes bacterium]
MRAALIANREDADPGFVGKSLRARGYSFVEFLREDFQQWPSLDNIELVVAMGSGWSTYWDHVAEPVKAEQLLLATAISQGIPILGICFGAQQLSVTLGGNVTKAQSTEIGWFSVENVPETAHLTPKSLTEGPWMQWHYDAFSIPTGATVLAQSAAGPQAMVCGRAVGLQFHPEATESIVRTWASGDGESELAAIGLTETEILNHTRAQLDDAARRCDDIVDWFLTDIAQRHME